MLCPTDSSVFPFHVGETLPEENPEHPELQLGWDSESTWLLSSLDSSDMTTVFGEYLQPSQMTDVLLVGIEALTADDIYDRQLGSNILDMAMRDPASWLTDVPKIVRYLHKNMEHICTEPARQSLDSLLLLLTKRCPREVVRSLLKISPTCDSAALAVWEVMTSAPWALWSVLTELLSVLQDQRLRKVFSCATEDACIYPLALLLCTDIETEEFAALYKAQRFLRHPSLVMLSLVLRGLITLSKTPETARKIPVLLPDIMETLQDANTDVKMKALVLLRNMMGHMKREEASVIALQLAEKLLPLFDDVSSQVRELSISFFKDVMKTVVGRNMKKMKKKVQRVLLPLFLHMNDQIESVAKASGNTLLACACFLRWRKLSYLAETHQTHLIGECLLLHNRSRVEDYLCQSLPYLKDTQATLRVAAIRFIGLAARHLRDQSSEKLWDICNALLPLAKDKELLVRTLAADTIFVLTRDMRTSGWSLRSLCCWPL
ncbi:maestro heat-like repeat-containing protein family member 7 [Spheniscus humboldti]